MKRAWRWRQTEELGRKGKEGSEQLPERNALSGWLLLLPLPLPLYSTGLARDDDKEEKR